MGGRSKRRSPPGPRDVPAGGVEARIDELFEHPPRQPDRTDRARSEPERADSYALKARLRSLLIDAFGDALGVEEMAGGEQGVIILRHRRNRWDGCHALVDELSPEARAWVRLQRDLREDVSSESLLGALGEGLHDAIDRSC